MRWIGLCLLLLGGALAQDNPNLARARLSGEPGKLRLVLDLPQPLEAPRRSGRFDGRYSFEVPFEVQGLTELRLPAGVALEATSQEGRTRISLQAPPNRAYFFDSFSLENPVRLVLDLFFLPESSEDIAPGFRLHEWWMFDPQPTRMQVLQADAGAWRMEPVGQPGLRQNLLQMAPQALAVLNGGYFDLRSGTPIGLWVQNGVALSLPFGRTALLWENNQVFATKPQFSATVIGKEGVPQRVGLNRYPARLTAHTLGGNVGRAGEQVAVVQGDVIAEIQPAPYTLPEGAWGLSFPPDSAFAVGDPLRLVVSLQPPLLYALEGGPLLVQAGQYAFNPASEPFNDPRPLSANTPQAAVAWSQEGALWLVVTEATTPALLAQELQRRGAWGAIRMDGGGSSQLAVQGRLRFSASNPPRAVVSALAVYPK